MKISEYIMRPDLKVPVGVMDKIQQCHANPMSYVRQKLGVPIIVSKSSGYRPLEHEIDNGRDGTSEHVFHLQDRPGSEKGLGAADYTTLNDGFYDMVRLISKLTNYSRIAFYTDTDTQFVHCDYRYFGSKKQFFLVRRNAWKQTELTSVLEAIKEIII